jgi:translation elongation factor P/translation initiation factor 5A
VKFCDFENTPLAIGDTVVFIDSENFENYHLKKGTISQFNEAIGTCRIKIAKEDSYSTVTLAELVKHNP